MIPSLRPVLRSSYRASTRIVPTPKLSISPVPISRTYAASAQEDSQPKNLADNISNAPDSRQQKQRDIRKAHYEWNFEGQRKYWDDININGYSLGKKALALKFPDQRRLTFDYAWLRDGCKCPRCVDPGTRQRNFNAAHIASYIRPQAVKWDGQTLEILWRNDIEGYDNHKTTYTADYLARPGVDFGIGTGRSRGRFHWRKRDMEKLQHWVSFDDYMNDDDKFAAAMKSLSGLGIIFVKDIPQSREMVEKIATRMGPLRNTFYGSTWDVRSVPDAKNVAYTAKPLDFHMDLMYMDNPPGFQLLHCLENSCEGGESLFADTFLAEFDMRAKYPHYADQLEKLSLSYSYDHDNAVYNNSWPVFQYYPRPLKSGRRILLHVNYSPPFQSHIMRPSWNGLAEESDTPQYPLKPLGIFAKHLGDDRNIFKLKLEPGQCVIFENRRVVHSRRQFDNSSGKRWLAGAYVDDDALISRFRQCARNNPEAWASDFGPKLMQYLSNKRGKLQGRRESQETGVEQEVKQIDASKGE